MPPKPPSKEGMEGGAGEVSQTRKKSPFGDSPTIPMVHDGDGETSPIRQNSPAGALPILPILEGSDSEEKLGTTPPPSEAFDRVFKTAELAEMIFLLLPMKDVLCGVQATCRQWCKVTQTSAPIQELLFRKPISTRMLHWMPDVATPQHALEEGIDPDHWAVREDRHMPLAVIEHPFLFMLSDSTSGNPAAIWRPEASWRRQLLTQPPVGEVAVCTDEEWKDLTWIRGGSHGGVTMGDVAGVGAIYGIRGWARWQHHDGYASLKRLKDRMRVLR